MADRLLGPWLLGALLALAPACSTPGADRFAPGVPALVEALAELQGREGYRGAHLGVLVKDLETGRTLLALNPHKTFLPASNAKLFTAALALRHLEPSWQTGTGLYRTGPVRGGVVEGDLVLRGGGDPHLGVGEKPDAPFRALAARLFAAGVRVVAGRVVADDDLLPEPHLGVGWAWDDLASRWAAPFGALAFHRNHVELRIAPMGRGVPPRLEQHPPGLALVTDLRPGEKAALHARPDPNRPEILLTGTLPAAGATITLRLPVADPSRFAARAFERALQAEGIAVRGGVADMDDLPGYAYDRTPARRLGRIPSPPLTTLLRGMLHHSHNLDAENLLRLAARAAGEEATAPGAARALAALLDELGVDARDLNLADGSGLSRMNQVTPAQVVGLLEGAWRSPWGRPLLSLLPEAGREGTLEERFREVPGAVGRIRAKTGTLTRVVALSGYIGRPGRPPLAFAWLVQGFAAATATVRSDQDRILGLLVGPEGP